MKTTGQDASPFPTADRPEVHPLGPANQTFTSGISEVQPPDSTGQPATVVKKRTMSLTGLESLLRNRYLMQSSSVTVLQAMHMKVRSLTWNLVVRIRKNC